MGFISNIHKHYYYFEMNTNNELKSFIEKDISDLSYLTWLNFPLVW